MQLPFDSQDIISAFYSFSISSTRLWNQLLCLGHVCLLQKSSFVLSVFIIFSFFYFCRSCAITPTTYTFLQCSLLINTANMILWVIDAKTTFLRWSWIATLGNILCFIYEYSYFIFYFISKLAKKCHPLVLTLVQAFYHKANRESNVVLLDSACLYLRMLPVAAIKHLSMEYVTTYRES